MHTLRYENSETENVHIALGDAPKGKKKKNQLKHGKTNDFKPGHYIYTRLAYTKHKDQASYGKVKTQKLIHSGQWLISGKGRKGNKCGIRTLAVSITFDLLINKLKQVSKTFLFV